MNAQFKRKPLQTFCAEVEDAGIPHDVPTSRTTVAKCEGLCGPVVVELESKPDRGWFFGMWTIVFLFLHNQFLQDFKRIFKPNSCLGHPGTLPWFSERLGSHLVRSPDFSRVPAAKHTLC